VRHQELINCGFEFWQKTFKVEGFLEGLLKVLNLRDVFGSPKPSKNFFFKVLVKVFGEGFFLRDKLRSRLYLT